MEGLRIDRATVRRALLGDRERLIAALAPVSAAATGVPASATLVVRQVKMPVPLPRHGSPDRFAATLQALLHARLASAVRGSHRRGDADYLFEDDAALEVAIIADWLAAPVSSGRNWWTSVVGNAPPVDRWRRHVLLDAVRLPRIVARLVEAGWATRWLARFDPGELAAATDRMLRAVGAPRLPAPVATDREARPLRATAPQSALNASRTQNPVAQIAPEARDVAPQTMRLFVAVALTLARRPALAATSGFAEALLQFVAAPCPTPARMPRRVRARPSTRPASGLVSARNTRSVQQAEAPTGSAPPALPRDASRPAGFKETRPTAAVQSPSTETCATQSPPEPGVAVRHDAAPVAHGTVDTEFGGLLFLLNAFAALGLYGDFTRPADGLRGLSPFELLDLLAAHWFSQAYRADPLAPLLHRLAGLGPRQRAGRDFEAPVWLVPDAWLRPWPTAMPLRRGSAHWHPAGFPIANDAAASLSVARRRRRWVHCLARYLEARLKQVTGDDDALALVCRRPARIVHDAESVEISLALDRHPLALRLAGLDRDLGWLPAAGRHIAFVFA